MRSISTSRSKVSFSGSTRSSSDRSGLISVKVLSSRSMIACPSGTLISLSVIGCRRWPGADLGDGVAAGGVAGVRQRSVAMSPTARWNSIAQPSACRSCASRPAWGCSIARHSRLGEIAGAGLRSWATWRPRRVSEYSSGGLPSVRECSRRPVVWRAIRPWR